MLKELFHKDEVQDDGLCSVVIVAAGQSRRMKGEDKILALLNGKPVIQHTIEAFSRSEQVGDIIVVTREAILGEIAALCREQNLAKVRSVVCGGETRVDSVMNGLSAVPKKQGLVAIHDGARPLVTQNVIEKVIAKARQFHAAAPAIPVKDTIKVAKNRIVTETPVRSTLYAVQTPQIFDYDLLRGALCDAIENGSTVTDDCSAVELLGMSVYLAEGIEENIKITTPIDLQFAEMILNRR